MWDVIIGNVCSFGAMLTDSYSGTRKTNKEILMVQCISQFFYFASSLILKGYSACAQNVVSVFRNYCAAKEKSNKALDCIFIVLPVILGIVFNNRGLLGYLPIVANLQYAIAMFVFKGNPIKLKYSLIIVGIMFSIFNFAIINLVGGIGCTVVAVTTAISIYQTKKNKKESE